MSAVENKKVRLLRRTHGKLQAELKPIVLEYKKRKTKTAENGDDSQEKYTEGLEDIQRMEGNVLRVAHRATKALSKGIETYDNERKRSEKEKTDGAIEDFFHNSAKATSAVLKETSEIPIDLAESLDTTSYRKRLRQNLRRASRIIRLWRI